jgi:hypothetical protein
MNTTPQESAERLLLICSDIDMAIAACDRIIKFTDRGFIYRHYILVKGYLLLKKYFTE